MHVLGPLVEIRGQVSQGVLHLLVQRHDGMRNKCIL
jgi:hypothetical protein